MTKKIRMLSVLIPLIITFVLTAGAQQINTSVNYLSVNQGPLASALQTLQQKAGINLIYDANDVRGKQTEASEFRNETVRDILKKLTLKTDLMFEEKQGVIILKPVQQSLPLKKTSDDNAQSVNVKGTVTDIETQEALVGVNVVVKGKTTGTITDRDGAFALDNLEESDVLVFSMIGYQSVEEAVGNRTTLNVALQADTKMLADVVVIGYGEVNKSELTNSVASISPKDFNRGVVASPDQLLQGKVAGLTITRNGDPNGNPSIVLRGASTLRTGEAQEPFYVIDGVPGASIRLVAPDDIVSIDVLKDASATAIYGSRAANGVIIITTRKAKPVYGLTYSGYVGVEQVSNKIDMLSGDELRQYVKANGKALFTRDVDYTINGTDTTFTNTDWQDEVQRTGVSQNHTISYGGGTEKANFNASVNYFKKEGIMIGSSSERVVGKLSLEQKAINDRLTLTFQLTNSVQEQKLIPEAVFRQMTSYLPTVNVYNSDGSFKENTIDHTSNYYNPLAIIELNKEEKNVNTLLGYGNARVEILDWLHYNLSLSYQRETTQGQIYQDSRSILPIGIYTGAQVSGMAKRYAYTNTRKVLENYVDLHPVSSDHHDLKVLAGYSWQYDENNDGFQATNSGFVSNATGANNLALGSDKVQTDFGTYGLVPLRMISFYARANYALANKYLFQASIRRDGSSAFGKNNRWGNFPAASAAWIINREAFFANQNIIQELKLRVGYGITGNSLGFDPLITVERIGDYGNFYYNGQYTKGMRIKANVNPDLRWEETAMVNIGLDFAVLNKKLSGTVEYYDKKTTDLIYPYTVSTMLYPLETYTANVGEMSNKGIELTLNATPVSTQNLRWDITAVLSHNQNEVVKLSNERFRMDSIPTAEGSGAGVSGVFTQIIKEGYPVGQFNVYQYAGRNEKGISTYVAADGSITAAPKFPADARLLGNAQPKLTYGFSNTVSWKNWSLNVFFRGTYGNEILNSTRAMLSATSQATLRNIPKSAQGEPMTDTNNNFYSNRYIESGSYLRLDNATLGYTIPVQNNNYIKAARVYLTGQNLFVITDYTGIDPEVNLGGLTPGYDHANYYPKTRSFLVGVTLDF